MATQTQNQGSSNRGFAGMDPEQQRQIASMGGKAAHESGNAHEFTSEEAREAGRKGGEASHEGGNRGGNQGGNRGGQSSGGRGKDEGGKNR
jgi:general stress protein YciG